MRALGGNLPHGSAGHNADVAKARQPSVISLFSNALWPPRGACDMGSLRSPPVISQVRKGRFCAPEAPTASQIGSNLTKWDPKTIVRPPIVFSRHEPFMSTQLANAVVRIRGMILRGELAPGQRVAEAPLAERLGVSRTPVRQALPLLAQEGLLAEHETRGFVVRAFTAADIVDAIDLRGVLEGLVVRRVAEKGASRAALRELRSCLEDGDAILTKRSLEESDEARYAEMNARFHAILLREADSAILSDALERNARIPFGGSQALAFDKTNLEPMYDALHYAHRQHHAIVEAIENGQSGRAEALMQEHVYAVKLSLNVAGLGLAAGEDAARLVLAR